MVIIKGFNCTNNGLIYNYNQRLELRINLLCRNVAFVYLHVFIFTLISAVERYDPRSNRWTPVSPMGTRRKHLGVAVYNNMIYAVGGRDDTTELSSAERYNPQTNTWQAVVAMTSRRSGVCGLLKVGSDAYCHKNSSANIYCSFENRDRSQVG